MSSVFIWIRDFLKEEYNYFFRGFYVDRIWRVLEMKFWFLYLVYYIFLGEVVMFFTGTCDLFGFVVAFFFERIIFRLKLFDGSEFFKKFLRIRKKR